MSKIVLGKTEKMSVKIQVSKSARLFAVLKIHYRNKCCLTGHHLRFLRINIVRIQNCDCEEDSMCE